MLLPDSGCRGRPSFFGLGSSGPLIARSKVISTSIGL